MFMKSRTDQARALFQELNENPYRRLNFSFFLIGIIPLLSMMYILFDKVFLGNKAFADAGPILFISIVILVLGYVLAYGVIKNIIGKALDYGMKAKMADQAKSSFAMSLAHDLKSPIATIKANISNLHTKILGELNDDQQKAVRISKDAADRMNTIISELINAYTYEAQQAELKKTIFDLCSLLEAQYGELISLAQERGVELKTDFSRDPVMIEADYDKITRAVNNLFSNSIKHTESPGEVFVRAMISDGFARVDFFNTGKCIPREKLEKIFDKFERLNVLIEGQGLGLSIAKDIVELHGGKVWAASESGKRNCFTMLLMLARN